MHLLGEWRCASGQRDSAFSISPIILYLSILILLREFISPVYPVSNTSIPDTVSGESSVEKVWGGKEGKEKKKCRSQPSWLTSPFYTLYPCQAPVLFLNFPSSVSSESLLFCPMIMSGNNPSKIIYEGRKK